MVMSRLIKPFTGCTSHFVSFVILWLITCLIVIQVYNMMNQLKVFVDINMVSVLTTCSFYNTVLILSTLFHNYMYLFD